MACLYRCNQFPRSSNKSIEKCNFFTAILVFFAFSSQQLGAKSAELRNVKGESKKLYDFFLNLWLAKICFHSFLNTSINFVFSTCNMKIILNLECVCYVSKLGSQKKVKFLTRLYLKSLNQNFLICSFMIIQQKCVSKLEKVQGTFLNGKLKDLQLLFHF